MQPGCCQQARCAGIATEKISKPDLKDLFNEDFLNDWWNFIRITSRRCERAFQALMALEYDGRHCWSFVALLWPMTSDLQKTKKSIFSCLSHESRDGSISQKINFRPTNRSTFETGWTVERLTLVEKTSFVWEFMKWQSLDTPQIVAVNEAVELAKRPFQMKPLHDLSTVSSVNRQKNKKGEGNPTS